VIKNNELQGRRFWECDFGLLGTKYFSLISFEKGDMWIKISFEKGKMWIGTGNNEILINTRY